MEHLIQHVESLIFTTEQPITLDEIRACLEAVEDQKITEEELLPIIEQLKVKYAQEDFSFEIVEIADGYQFLTKGDYFQTIATYLKLSTKKRLSRAAMETLAILAYKQPVTKSAMEQIRGVSCDYSVQKLLEKELITIIGRSDGPGRPLLYGTSAKFMDYMGIKDLNELPKIKDFKTPDSEIGEVAPIEEETRLEDPAEAHHDDLPAENKENPETEEQNAVADVEDTTAPDTEKPLVEDLTARSAPVSEADAPDVEAENAEPAIEMAESETSEISDNFPAATAEQEGNNTPEIEFPGTNEDPLILNLNTADSPEIPAETADDVTDPEFPEAERNPDQPDNPEEV